MEEQKWFSKKEIVQVFAIAAKEQNKLVPNTHTVTKLLKLICKENGIEYQSKKSNGVEYLSFGRTINDLKLLAQQ